MTLAKEFGKAFFAMSKTKQAKLIGCHHLTWEKTAFYLKAVEVGKITPPKPKAAKVFSFTSGREKATGEGEINEIQKQAAEIELRRLTAECEADNEPSPLENDPPGRDRKVHFRKRL
jgi:hypothetical protein